MLFQLYFVGKAGHLLYQEYSEGVTETLQTETFQQLYALGGYFAYDLAYLFQTTPTSGYVLHHLIGLGMLSLLYRIGSPAPPLVSAYNQLCLIAEITNPILSIRHFTKGTAWEGVQRHLMFWTYTLVRMGIYPILSYRLHQRLQHPSLFSFFVAVYGMSLVWYRRMVSSYLSAVIRA